MGGYGRGGGGVEGGLWGVSIGSHQFKGSRFFGFGAGCFGGTCSPNPTRFMVLVDQYRCT